MIYRRSLMTLFGNGKDKVKGSDHMLKDLILKRKRATLVAHLPFLPPEWMLSCPMSAGRGEIHGGGVMMMARWIYTTGKIRREERCTFGLPLFRQGRFRFRNCIINAYSIWPAHLFLASDYSGFDKRAINTCWIINNTASIGSERDCRRVPLASHGNKVIKLLTTPNSRNE